jgi:hypothetical protein
MVVPGMEGRRQADKLKWGLKLKLDVKKPVIGLAAHPREQEIVALFGDGALRGYKVSSGGLAPTFTLPGARARGGRAGTAGGRGRCFRGMAPRPSRSPARSPHAAPAVDSLAGRVSLAACLLETHPHPFIDGAAVLLYGTQNGAIMAFELMPREEPHLLLRARTPGGRAVIGMGLHKVGGARDGRLSRGGRPACGWLA